VTVSSFPTSSRCRRLLSFPTSEGDQTEPAEDAFRVNAPFENFLVLPKMQMRPRNIKRLKSFLLQEIAGDLLLEIELMGLALAAGINDATTFPDYHIYASNQTGNTVLLAVRALGLGGALFDLRDVGFSLGSFILGGWIFGQLGNRWGRRRRAWLLATNIVQTLLVFTAAALRKWVAFSDTKPTAWSVISLLAFASGGQVAMARTVDVPEITTAMVTSAYIDLLVDPELFQFHNRARNKRFLFVCFLLLGGFIGASAYRYVGPAFALLLSALCKAAICVAFLFNRPALEEGHGSQTFEQSYPEVLEFGFIEMCHRGKLRDML
jgi:uncharacterized membrane protein YoaK (UPF0700 family)